MKTFNLVACLFVTICLLAQYVLGANVLLALSLSSKSHKNIMDPILEGLMKKGHNVTVLSGYQARDHPKGVTTVYIKAIDDYLTGPNRANFFEMSKSSPLQFLSSMNEIMCTMANVTFSDPTFQEFIHSGQHFDLVLLDGILNDYMLVMPYHFKAPGVLLSPGSLFPHTFWNLDIPFPLAVHPIAAFPFPTPMSFKHRLLNTLAFVGGLLNRVYIFHPRVQEIIEQHFPGAPTVLQLEKNISMVMANTFPSLNGAQPLMPFVVEMGGIHCIPPKKLNKELENIVNASGDDGFIIFSLGTVTSGTSIPEDVRQKMLKVFAAQKQTVIWKYEGQMPDAPSNVKLLKWIPQQDLLGHPKCKLFVTHGGLLSLQEAVYHGVPVVAVPLSADQHGNALKTQDLGFGEKFYWDDFTEEEVLAKVDQVLHDPKYKRNIEKLSKLFKDRPMDIVENGVYWMEYVMRTGGAHHLKSTAAEVTWPQYFLLDVIAFVILVVTVTITVLFYITCKVIHLLKSLLFGRVKRASSVDKKNK